MQPLKTLHRPVMVKRLLRWEVPRFRGHSTIRPVYELGGGKSTKLLTILRGRERWRGNGSTQATSQRRSGV
jgi:hypothetical protein